MSWVIIMSLIFDLLSLVSVARMVVCPGVTGQEDLLISEARHHPPTRELHGSPSPLEVTWAPAAASCPFKLVAGEGAPQPSPGGQSSWCRCRGHRRLMPGQERSQGVGRRQGGHPC